MSSNDQRTAYADFLSILRRSTDSLNEDPIREEIFSVERLEQYASYLASELEVSSDPKRGRSLLPALKSCGVQLLAAYQSLAATIRAKQGVSPAAEWFVDNFHIVEDQLREIKQDLPANYYYELPKLATGELKGYPRVYAIALAIIAHTDSRLDSDTLKRFLKSYQQVSPLRIGELWAVAITLRIALVEQLTPLALLIVRAMEKREEGDFLADELLELAAQPETQAHELVQKLSDELGDPEYFDRALIVQLTQRLRDQSPDVWPAFAWIETQLQKLDTTTQQVTQLEHHRQAAGQVTVGNIITSMRLLSALDWRECVEEVCLVDRVLEKESTGFYDKMDFSSRDSYRHVIERLSKRSRFSELDIAWKAVGCADEESLHVGYFLVGDGAREFEATLQYRPRFFENISRLILSHPTFFYLGALSLITTFFLVPLIGYFLKSGGALWPALFFCGIAFFPVSEMALALLNQYITLSLKPRMLPKIDTEDGLPENAATLVVVPTLFTKESVVRELLEGLQVHYLANQDPQIYFALLGDFADAPTEEMKTDSALLKLAQDGIDELNTRYSVKPEKRFFLFHRRRKWNSSEGKWIGWERKRGKLLEFNRLLRGAIDTSYLSSPAEPAFLAKIKYVITLDSDTQLPRDSARRLVGTIEHPLNRPYFSPEKKRVTSGYGILQPRIGVSMTSAVRTRFAQLFSGNTSIDPYTTAVSDVYQDLFGEGSFTGKGLYVVDAFETALEGRVPENAVLSHDLFEGSYARSALVTDIELIDDYPSDYDTFSKRQHRWTRGDWQIVQWLFPWVPNDQRRWVRNNLSLIARWKIFDNLRRSIVPIATMIWLVLAWTVLPGSPSIWTLPVILMMAFPIYAPMTTGTFLKRRGLSWSGHFLTGLADTKIRTEQILMMVTFLAEQAVMQTDAIARTFYRMTISRKRLLEWVSFAQISQASKKVTSFGAWVGPGPLLAVVLVLLVGYVRQEALPVAAPFLLAWFFVPQIKIWTSRKARSREVPLGPEQIKAYRAFARRTWHFFENFLSAEDNWLAPDNFQEDPKPVVAHRTSPTNIGLQLLSTSSAFDFGYIGVLEFVDLLENTFSALIKLPTSRGHLFNWYDTRTLEPLRPQYISTVDSGNLCGHLLTLKQACLELPSLPLIRPQLREGLLDTLYQVHAEASLVDNLTQASTTVTLKQLLDAIDTSIEFARAAKFQSFVEWSSFLTVMKLNILEAEDVLNVLATGELPDTFAETRVWMTAALHQIHEFQRDLTDFSAIDIAARVEVMMSQCDEIALGMDFRFLFDEERKLFVIGFNATDGRRDNSYYDLLASESRLASFLAIAKGDIAKEHWFSLGRKLTSVHGGRALIAWTATMFEYLMPVLVMRRYTDTLLDQTYISVVARQIEYGKQHGVPWGISEAGYNARDLQLNYQYGPFGIPGLGLKRGLSDELVVAPYATMLAAMIDPWAALDNLQRLERLGALSKYGFFESIDYTPERLPKNQKSFILRSFMAHHQGMSLVSINNLLNGFPMQKRFHSEPLVQATQLLLQERIPLVVEITRPRAEEVHSEPDTRFALNPNPRVFSDVTLPTPRTQVLSNGTYSVMVTSTGAGYSRCGRLDVSRWREDVTQDHWGQYFYLRNRTSGAQIFSAGYQPTKTPLDSYEVTFSEDKVEFVRRDGNVHTHTEIIVSPEDNVELRRISLTNEGSQECEIEITSFMEVVLASSADESAHPAFSNLFVQTEFQPSECALLATRRRRSKNEAQVWGFHVLVTEGKTVGAIQYETDRSRFIGRGRTSHDPLVIGEDRPLSNTVGAVLDPIFSLRESVRIPAGETVRVAFATGVTNSREDALRLTDKYHDIHIFAREAEIAWTKSQVQLRHMNISTDRAHTYQRLAGRVLYADPSLRRTHSLALNTKTQAGLWAYGISGDLPIILSRISDEKDMSMVRELLHAHEYLRLKGLRIDLVILNERAPSYLQSLQEELQRQIRMSGSQALLDQPGGIFIRRTDIMPDQDATLLKSVARVTLSAAKGTLDEQLRRRPIQVGTPEPFVPTTSKVSYPEDALSIPKLNFFNGLGGFSDGARSYVIHLKEGQWTPAPWINVVANECDFGFLVSEAGAGYTWSVNSRENRLTSWSNDAVSDPVSEAIYIRDDESGVFWSPTPLPVREPESYVIHHGQGYSQFNHNSNGIQQELLMFVPLDATVKISRLKLKNTGRETRKLSVLTYTEWVLGFQRGLSAPHVISELDSTGLLFARNAYNNEFASRVAFADISENKRTFTCDRKEFLGRNGSAARPAAMLLSRLSGLQGAGLDPCAAFQTSFTLAPGEERELIVLLGEAETQDEARALAQKYRSHIYVREAYERVLKYWDETLGAVEIKTPDAAMNTLVNRWLIYQTLSCRIWARSAFYQSGGAFGFRDQLQDVMALVYTRPQIARDQILKASARQFKEGDVQHWWHPPTGRGVRTHFSDDLLWLPFVVSFYIGVTGDRSVLDEVVPFLDAPELNPGQDDSYLLPRVSTEMGTVLEHCLRTLDRSLRVGQHGLPLMGSGDWNDGMSRVGHEGRGESVWVAWFLLAVLRDFIPYCDEPEFSGRVKSYREHLIALKSAVETNAWDGDWYRRAYFDDGSSLGSAANEECRIDSIAQSWAVLSGAGDPARATRAMAAVDVHLIHRGDGLVKLFTPPFDKGETDPGYIKGYVPGVRENGGQYTHAAIWTLMAYAKQGDGDRAGELYALLNPINHALTRAGLHKYKVEPYVVAADIYAFAPNVGRGGWTWYTGSASWMYRAALESILGFKLNGKFLRIQPCIPAYWPEFEITYRRGPTTYQIQVKNRDAHSGTQSRSIILDGETLTSEDIPLSDDGKTHTVHVQL